MQKLIQINCLNCRILSGLSLPDVDLPSLHEESPVDTSNLCDNSEELYVNAPVTILKAVTILLLWFSSFPGVSKSAFSRLLYILGNFVLPTDDLLPLSYSEAMKFVNHLISPVHDYHCCTNDCIIYRDGLNGKYEKLTKSPVCNENRYCENSPRKTFKYILLEPRLRRWFGNETSSAMLQSHQQHKGKIRKVFSIHQSEAWKEW